MNLFFVLLAGSLTAPPPVDAREFLESALQRIGRTDGGLVFHAEGTRNQAAERQGRAPDSPDSEDRVPFRETIALDPARDRLAREYRYDRYDGTFEWLRDLYQGPEDRKILVLQDGFAVWLRSPDHASERRRYQRRIPHLLLAEALERPGALRWLGKRDGSLALAATLRDETEVTLFFDPETRDLEQVEYLADVQSWGDATLAWSFADWAPVSETARFPRRIEASVAGRTFLELEVQRVETSSEAVSALFSLPEGVTLPAEPRILPPASDPSARAEVREEAPGVYTVRNLRLGFHPLFVELGECVLAVDAPAGYRLLEQIPAGDVAPGPSSAWLSEGYLELIRETLPGRRVCWVALTHFHNDHGGGLRAFAAEGATLLVSPGDRAAVEALLANPHRVAPDRLSISPRSARLETVDGRRVLHGGGRTVEVISVGANPHTDEMLVVHLPEERFLFVSDLLTPAPLEDFPTPSHAALDHAFVEWLDRAGLNPERVYAMHGSGVATREHLAKLRQVNDAPRIVTVIADHPLDAAASPLPHVEPHVAVHPEDPRHLVVGSIVAAPDREGAWHCAALVSNDGGRSFRRQDFPMESCIDPWALVTTDGHALVAAIEIGREGPEDDRFRLLLFRSEDGGVTWTAPPTDLGRGHDHELLLQGPEGDLVLVSRRESRTATGNPRHAIGVMRSDDGGRSFTRLEDVRPSNLALNPTGLVRLSEGTLVVSFVDFQRDADGFEGRGLLRQPRAWVVRSTDGGRSFSEPLFASEGCGASDGFAGYPALAVDGSQGRFRDRLYHLCIRADFDGLALTTSDDGGETWSDPIRIDEVPEGGLAHARTPMLATNGDGVLAAAWYGREDSERRCQDVFFTASSDGGKSFLPPLRVSTETSCPETPENGRVARSWPMGGDYGSLAAASDGTFHLVWADSRSSRFQLHHAALRVETGARAGEGGRR